MTTDPQPQEGKRLPGAWIALLLLFGFLIFTSVRMALSPTAKEQNTFDQEQRVLRSSLEMKEAFSFSPSFNTITGPLEDLVDKALPEVKTNPIAAQFVAVVNTELKKPVPTSVLDAFKKSGNDVFLKIYGSKELSKADATSAASKLKEDTFIDKLAKVQAFEKAGVSPSGRDEAILVWKAYAMMLGVTVMVLIGVASIGVWLTYFVMRSSGKIPVLSPPAEQLPAIQADRLAWRAFQLIASFYVLSFLAQILAGLKLGLPPIMLNLIPSVGVLVLVFAYPKLPIGGATLNIKSIGLSTENFWKHVGIGALGFIAEFPLSLSLLGLGRVLFSFFPEPTHPAGEALTHNPTVVTILTILILGAVIAPFWEETTFRGMLFPAFSKVMGGYIPGALMSSFLFASIHPQGPVLWFSLGSVAMVSCLLVTHTKSLVPSITMHFLHNSLILLFGILIS